MRRPLAIALALTVLAVSASTTLAARSGSSGAKQGSVSITVFNDKANPTQCKTKISGQYLAFTQTIYISLIPTGNYALPVGQVDANGVLIGLPYTDDAAKIDRTHSLVAVTSGWYPVLDAAGNQAAWSINNTCRNPNP